MFTGRPAPSSEPRPVAHSDAVTHPPVQLSRKRHSGILDYTASARRQKKACKGIPRSNPDPVRLDFIPRLPVEIILLIFQYLDLPSTARISRLSKTWWTISRIPDLYQTISFEHFFRKLGLSLTEIKKLKQPKLDRDRNLILPKQADIAQSVVVLPHLFRLAKGSLRSLRLVNCQVNDSVFFPSFLQHGCHLGLTELCLRETTTIDVKALRRIVQFTKASLRVVDLSGTHADDTVLQALVGSCPKIHSVALEGCRAVKCQFPPEFGATPCPKDFYRLNLKACQAYQFHMAFMNIRELDVSGLPGGELPYQDILLHKTLTSLRMNGFNEVSVDPAPPDSPAGGWGPYLRNLRISLPYLQLLSLAWNQDIKDADMAQYFSESPNCGLKGLNISHIPGIGPQTFQAMADAGCQLAFIAVRNCPSITDQAFRRLSFQALEIADLSATRVSTDGIYDALTNEADKLRMINLSDCQNIRDWILNALCYRIQSGTLKAVRVDGCYRTSVEVVNRLVKLGKLHRCAVGA